MKNVYIVLIAIIGILGLLLFNQCKSNCELKKEISRQHNNVLAMTDTLKQYKDELGRTNAEKHAYQLTQEELRDSLGILKKQKNVEYITYTNTIMGVNDTIFETTFIDRTFRDTVLYKDNGVINVTSNDQFGKSSRRIDVSIPYNVDSVLHTDNARIGLQQDIFVESWLERNAKNGETTVHLRSDYPNLNFNSGMGIVATNSPEYEKSIRKTKGIGISVGPQIGVSYDLVNKKIAPTVGVGVGIGINITPKKLQW